MCTNFTTLLPPFTTYLAETMEGGEGTTRPMAPGPSSSITPQLFLIYFYVLSPPAARTTRTPSYPYPPPTLAMGTAIRTAGLKGRQDGHVKGHRGSPQPAFLVFN